MNDLLHNVHFIGFVQALAANPFDLATRLIFADWLADVGESMVEALVRTQGQLLEADPSSSAYFELLQHETDIRIGEHDYDLDYQLWSVIPRSISPTHEEIVRDFSIMGDKHCFELKRGGEVSRLDHSR